MKNIQFHNTVALQISFISICLVTAVVSYFGYQGYQTESARKASNLATELLSVVKTTAAQLDLNLHEEIYLTPDDSLHGKQELGQIQVILASIKHINGLNNGHSSPIYTLRKTSDFNQTSEIEFVAMSDPDKGTNFYTGTRMLIEGFQLNAFEGAAGVTPIYHDSDGAWISAVVPLRKDNSVIGIVQADKRVDSYFEQLVDLKQDYLITATVLIIISAFFSWLAAMYTTTYIYGYSTRPLKYISQAIHAITQGDYQYRIRDQRNDQFNQVYSDFNKMADEIDQANMNRLQQLSDLEQHNKDLALSSNTKTISLNAKNNFLANLSHEIRTPMTSIMGFTKVLLQQNQKQANELLLHRISNASDNLMRLVNQTLDLSKLESGQIELNIKEYDLYSELVELIQMNGEKVAEKHIDLILKITRPLPKRILGDCLRTSEVILNLISNAIKFTHNGYVQINIDYKLAADNSLDLIIEVSDTGVGMTKEACQHIFNPFTQADSSISQSYGGTGLGLTIAKEITEQMRGSITVKSELGVGSTFRAILKQQPSQSPAIEDIDQNTRTLLANKRFLIIEDCPAIVNLLTDSCAKYAIECEATNEISTAPNLYHQARAQGQGFDGIILDWPLVENNVERSMQLLAEQGIKDLPIFIMLPYNHLHEFTSQYDALITKPLIEAEVIDAFVEYFQIDEANAVNKVNDIAASATELNPATDAAQSHENQRILVVEDNINNQVLIEYLLDDYGIAFDLAENGQQALDKMQNTNYDLVLMDVQMPIMDGLTATTCIRENLDKTAMPVVALTANTTPNDCLRIKEVGMNDIVPKPVDTSLLYSVLDSYLANTSPSTNKMSSPNEQRDLLHNELETGPTELDTCYVTSADKKILIVEDNKNNQQLISYMLEDIGIEFSLADNGQHAISLLESDSFGLILMDMQMPIMDGISATQFIRKNSLYDKIPIIAMTANTSAEDEESCLAAGMDGMVAKPIDFDLFNSLLQTYVETTDINQWQANNFSKSRANAHLSQTKSSRP
ncbi:MAG: response regulator [Pseudomonadales bacterium]|nr:response regulator [Pseudomonadales bacterium]